VNVVDEKPSPVFIRAGRTHYAVDKDTRAMGFFVKSESRSELPYTSSLVHRETTLKK